jgi:hypothetical protein
VEGCGQRPAPVARGRGTNGEAVKAIADKTTVVLAGSFNPAILTPQWVAVHGLGQPAGQEFQVEMISPVGGAGATRFSFDGLSYSAGFRNVTLHLDGTQPAQCRASLRAAANILAQLPHTPVAGLGFNFAFSVDEPPDELLSLLTTHDGMTDSFPIAPEVVARKWGNTVKWNDALVTVGCELVGGQAFITFNFHYSTASAKDAETILRMDQVFENHQERAVAAAEALGGQKLEA